ncbi:uracil-DNA glycosylase [Mesorhizobium sp. CAU 1732]|uniref:uracil-DNA glycosylase n=1 Tax=Mesorhizobium sp. CAU 1732 TaxID=3140358 RepID=UPI0032618E4E
MAASHQSRSEPLPLTDVRELLRFYADAGVDEALLDEPVDRFAESHAATAARAPAAETNTASQTERWRRTEPAPAPRPAAPPTLSVPDEAQAARARDMAREAASLDELRAIVAGFDGCNLKFTAKQMVFADGNPQADLMLIGEAPGRDEDLEGLPFVGKSGRLLDRILGAIGIDRTSAYIANVIPWRPPGNRTPTPLETEICRPFIERQIELANPKVIMTLGGPAAKVVLHANEGVLRMRGNWKVHTTAAGLTIPAMPTLHPAYLLRNPAHKKLAWRDFLDVRAKLEELRG